MKKIIVLMLLCIIGISCSSIKYDNINILKTKHNEKNLDKLIIVSNKKFHPLKYVLKKLDNQISENFLLIFSWVNHLPRAGVNEFQCLIYDYNTKSTYFIINNENHIKKIEISTLDNNLFYIEKTILDKYLTGNIDVLTNMKPAFSSSEIGTNYSVIDLKTEKTYCITNFYLFPK